MKKLNSAKLDSFRVYIPLSKVKILNPKLTEDFIRYFPDLEIFDEEIEEAKPLTQKVNGITSRYYIKKLIQSYKDDGEKSKHLCIQVNAKMLKENYLSGITEQTIDQVYDYIIEQKVVEITRETFYKALITDIDICIDYKGITPKVAVDICKALEKKTVYPAYVQLFKPTKKNSNQAGINYNTRPKATPSKPHIKFYHKTLELKSKSDEFKDMYLQNQDISDIFRFEVTLKNSKDKKRNKIERYRTLIEFLSIKPSKLEEICQNAISNYLNMSIKNKKPKGLSPTDEILFNFMETLIDEKYSESRILSHVDSIKDRHQKSRKKNHLKRLLKMSEKQDILKHNTKVKNALDLILGSEEIPD